MILYSFLCSNFLELLLDLNFISNSLHFPRLLFYNFLSSTFWFANSHFNCVFSKVYNFISRISNKLFLDQSAIVLFLHAFSIFSYSSLWMFSFIFLVKVHNILLQKTFSDYSIIFISSEKELISIIYFGVYLFLAIFALWTMKFRLSGLFWVGGLWII